MVNVQGLHLIFFSQYTVIYFNLPLLKPFQTLRGGGYRPWAPPPKYATGHNPGQPAGGVPHMHPHCQWLSLSHIKVCQNVFCLSHPWRHLCAQFGWNRKIGNEMAYYYRKIKVAAAAILDFGCNFPFRNVSIWNDVLSLCFKFHQNWLVIGRFMTIYVK